ncbi:MAG: zinc-binding dehydrogenase, partial [Actinomycetes bacterium]
GRIRAAAPGGVDAALDLVGPEALNVSAEVLAPAGRLASVTDAALVASLGGRYVFVRPDAGDLAALVDLVDSGVLRITVDRRFPLEEAVAALRYSAAGHARGKVVLEVG